MNGDIPVRAQSADTPEPNFEGHEPRECGEHRTVGPHRAWCHDCGEWCYPASPCVRCEIVGLRAAAPGVNTAAGPHRVLAYGEADRSEWVDCDGEDCKTCAQPRADIAAPTDERAVDAVRSAIRNTVWPSDMRALHDHLARIAVAALASRTPQPPEPEGQG